MPGIFISYRREDSAPSAGRLYDHLVEHFGKEHVFRDIDTIAPGAEFAKVIEERGNISQLVQNPYNYGYVPPQSNTVGSANQKALATHYLWEEYTLS